VWKKFSALYQARGDEKYITFGRFAYPKDKRIIRQVQQFRNVKNRDRTYRILAKNKSLVVKQFAEPTQFYRLSTPDNYYLLDRVSVVHKVREKEEIEPNGLIAQDGDKAMSNQLKDLKVFRIDPGFEGDLTFNLNPKLEPGEAMFVDYGQRHLVIIINMDEKGSPSRTIDFTYVHKAQRLKGKQMRSYQKQLSLQEIESLQQKYQFEILEFGQFNTIVFGR